MPTGAMNVAMAYFFGRRSTNVNHFDVEVEGLAGKGMIRIDSHFAIGKLNDGHNHGVVIGLSLELHADREVFNAGKLRAWHDFNKCVILIAVTILWFDFDGEGIAFFLADKFAL